MPEPTICGVITSNDSMLVKHAALAVDLFELRIDLVGQGWEQTAARLEKPWIATNRSTACRGCWTGSEESRIRELLKALELGADIIDIEIDSPLLSQTVPLIKRKAECLISFHDWKLTPGLPQLTAMVRRQIKAGADICKVVTTATGFSDNLAVLELLSKFSDIRLVCFAMGTAGVISRVLSPLAGAYFTYASLKTGRGSAPGQPAAAELAAIYRTVAR